MENITIAIIISILITALYAVMKYAEKYYGTNPEQWDQSKFLQLIIVAVVLVVAGYYGQGIISQPDSALIEQVMAMLGAAVFALTGIKLGKNAAVAVTTTPTPTPPPQPMAVAKKVNRDWATFDATPENKEMILKQIDAAESAGLWSFKVVFAGGYYYFENGQMIGSAGNPSGK